MRAATALRSGSMRTMVEVASLMAQTAPSPTANAPPPGGTAILATTLAPRGGAVATFDVSEPRDTVAGGDGALPAVGLMRLSVSEAKLLTQTDVPDGAIATPRAAFAGGAKRIGGPTFLPERRSIRVTVPRSP